MNYLSVYIAGQQFYCTCTPEDQEALRRILSSTNYITWSIGVIDSGAYEQGKDAATNRANHNFETFAKKHKKWYQL